MGTEVGEAIVKNQAPTRSSLNGITLGLKQTDSAQAARVIQEENIQHPGPITA
jgi:hypothetical protein